MQKIESEKKVYPLYPPEPDRVQSLFQQLESAGTKEEQQMASENIVGYVTKQQFGFPAIIRAVDIASGIAVKTLHKSLDERNQGIRILNGIELYFNEPEPHYKEIADVLSPQVNVKVDDKVRDRIRKRIAELGNRGVIYPAIFLAIDNFEEHLEQPEPRRSSYFAYKSEGTKADMRSFEMILGNSGIRKEVQELYYARMGEIKMGPVKTEVEDIVIKLAKESSSYPIEGVHDLFKARFGGVSLEELVDLQDQDAFNQHALSYMANVPRGDVFWQRFIWGLFLQPLNSVGELPEEKLEEQSYTFRSKTNQMQQTMMKNLLLPMYDPAMQNEVFDSSLLEVFNSFDEYNKLEFQSGIFRGFAMYLWEELFLNDSVMVEEIDTIKNPLTKEILTHLIDKFPPELWRFVFYDQVGKVFTDIVYKSRKNIKSRFVGKGRDLAYYLSDGRFSDIYGNDYWNELKTKLHIDDFDDKELSRARDKNRGITESEAEAIEHNQRLGTFEPGNRIAASGITSGSLYKVGKDLICDLRIGEDSSDSVIVRILQNGSFRFDFPTITDKDSRERRFIEGLVIDVINHWREENGVVFTLEGEIGEKSKTSESLTKRKKDQPDPDAVTDMFERLIRGDYETKSTTNTTIDLDTLSPQNS
jgi:hypothetical protein